MKILFLFPYPHGTAASQRFRFEQYLSFLEKNGHSYRLQSFIDEKTWQILYKPGHALQKVSGIVRGFLRRIAMLASVHTYDFVFIHREAAPLGPPVFEWLLAKVFRKKIVFDFDDAIWLPNTSENNRMAARLKWHHKTGAICRWAWKVSAGNRYLADYSRQHRAAGDAQTRVYVNPTTIDTTHLHNRLKTQDTPHMVIGWTGTHSTISYLDALVPGLEKLEKKYDFIFLVISDKPPAFTLRSLQYIPWNKATEADDLLRMNIGVMPLTDDPWSRGKCGFKALQYMALGIPPVVSPVGVNTDIVQSGRNGFVCHTSDEWEQALEKLIQSVALRTQLGQAARHTIESRYSVQANERTFLDFFTA